MTEKTDMLWVDTETFGVKPEDGPIIEFGLYLTDADLNIKASWSQLCWSGRHNACYRNLGRDSWVFKQHTSSGLWDDAMSLGVPSLAALSGQACDWIEAVGAEKLPMCGSTVGFDRGQLRYWCSDVEALFHYRTIDVSSVKELCRRWNPEVYKKMGEYLVQQKKHRVIPDLDDSIAEAQYYRDNFVFCTV